MIFYFSGTGNSEYTARKIAERLGEDAVSIGDCTRNDLFSFTLQNGERVGFVFPVYFWGLPTIVKDFIGQLDLHNYRDNYTYSVCTNGGDSGDTQAMLQKSLTRRSIRLDAAFEVAMPDNYIIILNYLTPANKIAGVLEAAEGTIAAIAENIAGRKPVPVVSGAGRRVKTILAYPVYKYGRSTRPFRVSDDCNGCGLCVRVCPCSMIEIRERRPVWSEGRCTQCLGCLHRCPKRAIQYGRKTEKRGRYVNPNMK